MLLRAILASVNDEAMAKQRGPYARKMSEHEARNERNRIHDADAYEFKTARIVGIACDDFWKERNQNTRQQHDNSRRFRR